MNNIESEYKKLGKTVEAFYIESKLTDIMKLADHRPSPAELTSLSNLNCEEEFKKIKEWNWKSISTLADFYESALMSDKISLANKLKISEATFGETTENGKVEGEKIQLDADLKKIADVESIDNLKLLTPEDRDSLMLSLNNFKSKLIDNYFALFFENEAKLLEKFTIDFIKNGLAAEQGIKPKPSSYGLATTYEDFSLAKSLLEKIKKNLSYQEHLPDVLIATLPTKGNVYRRTFIGFCPQKPSSQKGWLTREFFDTSTKVGSHKALVDKITKARNGENSINLVGEMENLKNYFASEGLASLDHFKNYTNRLVNGDNDDFKPSNGEESIILVDSAISSKDADVIILDEPDSGMGSDFVNGELLTKIQEQAKASKTIVISTHDPNLVVRTHPYSCIYREESSPGIYKTYIGSSFEDLMINPDDKEDTKKWVDACIDKCEGGYKALNERERTYGNYRKDS